MKANFCLIEILLKNKYLAFLDQGNNKNTTLKASEFEKVEGCNSSLMKMTSLNMKELRQPTSFSFR